MLSVTTKLKEKVWKKSVCVKLVDCGFEKNYEGLQRLINEHKSSRGEKKGKDYKNTF